MSRKLLRRVLWVLAGVLGAGILLYLAVAVAFFVLVATTGLFH